MPDENEETVVHEEEMEMNPISKLIWEVSQQTVLYDSRNPLYKDSTARQAAWQNVAREMKIPVTDCQIKWGTLRRCLANARKRQMKRQAGGSKFIKKWRYQDEMAFLLPFIDQREYEFINVSARSRKSTRCSIFDYEAGCVDPLSNSQDLLISEEYEPQSESDDAQQTETKPNSEKLQMYVIGKSDVSPLPAAAAADAHGGRHHQTRHNQQSSALISASFADEMYIEEDEIENVSVETDGNDSSFGQLRHSKRFLSSSGGSAFQKQQSHNVMGEVALDEMDSFFLSMSKALKKLPQVDQINVRSQVYNLVTRAEINWLQKASSPPQTPSTPTTES